MFWKKFEVTYRSLQLYSVSGMSWYVLMACLINYTVRMIPIVVFLSFQTVTRSMSSLPRFYKHLDLFFISFGWIILQDKFINLYVTLLKKRKKEDKENILLTYFEKFIFWEKNRIEQKMETNCQLFTKKNEHEKRKNHGIFMLF